MARTRELSDVPIFVDLQGFIMGDIFRVKEVAVLRRGDELTHYVFRAPLAWNLLTKDEKQQANWLTAHHHHLHWKDGDIEFRQAKKLIRCVVLDGLFDGKDDEIIIYVKGLQKKTWLQQYLDEDHECRIDSIEVDFEDIERLRDLKASRSFHCRRHVKNCAMDNVIKLYKWWSQRARNLFPPSIPHSPRDKKKRNKRETRDLDIDEFCDDDDDDGGGNGDIIEDDESIDNDADRKRGRNGRLSAPFTSSDANNLTEIRSLAL
ncbi:uncharacterized protein LOC105196833 isoform X2 [Solenopsis invicta]|uniref:uncharacterized protein LOC105196833 isoform X2 n=1 Tax=Solenopsis invicta TaxID=13686 RepID=UPI00193CE539|nr:uncharacterized protein LOC105196833 isoform X2 [Solenopsis invicta]